MRFYRDTWVEINLDIINDNFKQIKEKYTSYDYIFAVVKANGYGHGDVEIAKQALESGATHLAVSSLDEALKIRKSISKVDILCLGVINPDDIQVAAQNDISITVHDINWLRIINTKDLKGKIKCHIKYDSGMNRLGIKDSHELLDIIKKINDNDNLILEGLYTHFATADKKDDQYYHRQLANFEKALSTIDVFDIPVIHVANSAALLGHDKLPGVNGARLGIAMYGFNPLEEDIIDLKLQPAFSLYSQIYQIKKVLKGESIGYGATYKASKDCLVGIVPIGYADGFIRKNEGREVVISNKRYKIVGRICMDQLMIEIDNTINVGDKVTLLGSGISIEEVAEYLDTITYEVICMISDRVPRVYIKKGLVDHCRTDRF